MSSPLGHAQLKPVLLCSFRVRAGARWRAATNLRTGPVGVRAHLRSTFLQKQYMMQFIFHFFMSDFFCSPAAGGKIDIFRTGLRGFPLIFFEKRAAKITLNLPTRHCTGITIQAHVLHRTTIFAKTMIYELFWFYSPLTRRTCVYNVP